MKPVLAAALSLISLSGIAAEYNLPIKATCNGRSFLSYGVFICSQKTPATPIFQVKIPPTRGQLRLRDCNRDLTEDGNPDDFNTESWSSGWFLFNKKYIRYTGNPSITTKPRTTADNGCPIIISTTGQDAGTQRALVYYNIDNKLDDILKFQCGPGEFVNTTVPSANPYVNDPGIGYCSAFEGAQLNIMLQDSPYIGVINIESPLCGISRTVKFTDTLKDPIQLSLPKGLCILNIQLTTDKYTKRTKMFTYGTDISSPRIDSPTMIQDGKKRRIFKPIGSTVVHTELYRGTEVLWRSGLRTDDSYHIDPGADNKPGLSAWPAGTIACHTAYSKAWDSMSYICYDIVSLQVVEYNFY